MIKSDYNIAMNFNSIVCDISPSRKGRRKSPDPSVNFESIFYTPEGKFINWQNSIIRLESGTYLKRK